MEAAAALRTLELLADGRDPETGLSLPEASPFNQPIVVRSLFAAIRALDSASRPMAVAPGVSSASAKPARVAKTVSAVSVNEAASATRRVHPANAGKPWTVEEDAVLCTEFDQGVPIRELATKHGRSTTALNARLFKLGKIADPGIPLRHPVTPPAAFISEAGRQEKRTRPAATPPAA